MPNVKYNVQINHHQQCLTIPFINRVSVNISRRADDFLFCTSDPLVALATAINKFVTFYINSFYYYLLPCKICKYLITGIYF